MLAIDNLHQALEIRQLDSITFMGESPSDAGQRIFGGHLLAQSLLAAYRTVTDLICHSLHAYFVRAGIAGEPVKFQVESIRNGEHFATRHLVAMQRRESILVMSLSFHRPALGYDFQSIAAPAAPAPDTLMPEGQRISTISGIMPSTLRFPSGIDARWTDPQSFASPTIKPPTREIWIRGSKPIPRGIHMQQASFAYGSDLAFMETALRPLGLTWANPDLHTASIDHAIWFHDLFEFNDWHLYASDCPRIASGRALNRGHLFAGDGSLVASTAQEAIIRRRQSTVG